MMDPKNMDDGWDTVPTETPAPVVEEAEAAVDDDADVEGEEAEVEDVEGGDEEVVGAAPRGPRPGVREATRAKCFECCGDMLDGRMDCQIVKCPLYWWQPYRKLTPDLSWRVNGSHVKGKRTELLHKAREERRQRKGDV